MPRSSSVVVLVASGLLASGLTTGCSDTALVLDVGSSELTAPVDVDAVCLSIAAIGATGDREAFARAYPITALPQTLTVFPGSHGEVQIWARGRRGGLEVARAGARTSFEDGTVDRVALELRRCHAAGGGGALIVRGHDALPDTRVAVALGWRRPVAAALPGAGGDGAVFGADRDQGLSTVATFGGGAARQVLAADVDGDCDDDLIVVDASGAAALLRHDGDDAFAAVDGAIPATGVVAVAAADVDADGDLDLAIGGGAVLALYRNDGSGRFAVDGAGIPAGGVVTDVTALAFGDVSGDGQPDLVVGQGSSGDAPNALFVDDAGFFDHAPAALPALPGRTRALALGDADADGDIDLVVARAGAAVKLYVNRGDGRLEDRSFVRLPNTGALDATAVALGDLDGDCLPDLFVAEAAGGAIHSWRGTANAAFVDTPLPAEAAGADLALGDVDGDGANDLIVSGAVGVTWLSR